MNKSSSRPSKLDNALWCRVNNAQNFGNRNTADGPQAILIQTNRQRLQIDAEHELLTKWENPLE